MTFDEFYGLTVAEASYWLEIKSKKFKSTREWEAQLHQHLIQGVAYAINDPKNIPPLHKKFPSLFNEEISEEDQEARFIAGVMSHNAKHEGR